MRSVWKIIKEAIFKVYGTAPIGQTYFKAVKEKQIDSKFCSDENFLKMGFLLLNFQAAGGNMAVV